MKKEYTVIDGIQYNALGDPIFTEEMKKDYTLLIPVMSEVHFKLLGKLFETYGYNVALLNDADTREDAEIGLKYVHNDMCYPAILVIGQLMRAVLSGKYDTHKVALVLMYTAGGCRASNYAPLLKKALKKNGYGYIPVLAISFDGSNEHPAFRFNFDQMGDMIRMLYYGDLLMLLVNQCEPYETEKGTTQRLASEWIDRIIGELSDRRSRKDSYMEQNYYRIIADFEKIQLNDVKKPRVGIVGEIYVQHAPLGNNNLVRYLVDNGAEAVEMGLTNFIIYCIYSAVLDSETYGMNRITGWLAKRFCKKLVKRYKLLQKALAQSKFNDVIDFDEANEYGKDLMSRNMIMGEGYILVVDIIELINLGVKNIIIVQPFGCLCNHIIGRGMMKRLKEEYPDVNIISIDYDSNASIVNQENRIKLLLSNAKY